MLLELRIENLLLIDRAELRPGESLNAITGETGAGKTVLAHALDLLLGGKARSGIVRPGAEEAYVEGVFEDGDEEVVLARRVTAEGRTRAYVNHRSSTAADLRDLGGRLLSFFGQHEHRKLTVAGAQLELLDGFAGAAELRERVAAAHARVREAERELEDLRGRAGTRDRDLGLLAFEIQEIEELRPERRGGERAGGRARPAAPGRRPARRRGGGRRGDRAGGRARARRRCWPRPSGWRTGWPGADAELDALAERMRGLRIEAEDLGAELRRYLEGLDADPERLHVVEERLDAYDRLKRKHGGTVEAVLEHAERCRADRDRLENGEVALEQAQAALDAAVAERRGDSPKKLTRPRRKAAPKLAKRVLEERRRLAMEGASFSVELEPREEIGPSGAERVEFMLAPNSGRRRRPRARERVGRRALTRDARADDRRGRGRVLDAGVRRGRLRRGRPDGARRRRAAAGAGRRAPGALHHPPAPDRRARRAPLQDREARAAATSRAPRSSASRTAGVVEELCRMLGADSGDAGARRHAEELLAAA